MPGRPHGRLAPLLLLLFFRLFSSLASSSLLLLLRSMYGNRDPGMAASQVFPTGVFPASLIGQDFGGCCLFRLFTSFPGPEVPAQGGG